MLKLLRPYQTFAINEIENTFAAGTRTVCLQLPTGGG